MTVGQTTDAAISVVPANQASWDDLRAVFGERGNAAWCQCQWFKFRDKDWQDAGTGERAERLREQTGCGDPDATSASGLVAYLDGEPVGWCAVEPRTAYVRLRYARVPWKDRDEDRDDAGVWALTCFVTRKGFRRRGVSRALAAAAVGFARERGARALEGYPLLLRPGQEATWGELFVGSPSVFEAAGFTEVSRPTQRRAVMRIELGTPKRAAARR